MRSRALLLLPAVALLAGCSAPEPPTGRELVLALAAEAQEQGHPAQYELMKDGVVDLEDYDTAYRQLRACLEAGGMTVTDPIISPADGLRYIFEYDANGLAPQTVDEVQGECEAQFWVPVNAAYADTNPAVMEEALRTASLECLEQAGFDMTGEERNFPEMVGDPDVDGGDQREAAADCVFTAAHELYPELPNLTLIA
ncbi:MAG: hypothetical protein JWP85_2307 [Rhodoglobus sp.]|nr:hypothetical protein [Rhodoglobus sp.]